MTPGLGDTLTTAAGGGAAMTILAGVRWELVPHGELVKIVVAFALLWSGYLMYKGKKLEK